MSWRLFKQYSSDMAAEVLSAFDRVGYTQSEAEQVADNISSTWYLPAHGTGGTDSGTQGNYPAEAMNWKNRLIEYANNNPKAEKAKPDPSRKKHQTPQQKAETDARKQVERDRANANRHRTWHIKNPTLRCGMCGRTGQLPPE